MSKIIWFASRGSHQAQIQGILGHLESILMSKIIWFDAGSSHQVQLSGISGYSENISMVDNRLALLLAVYIIGADFVLKYTFMLLKIFLMFAFYGVPWTSYA